MISEFTPLIWNGFLLLIQRLRGSNQPLGRATLLPLAEIKLPGVAEAYDQLVASLIKGGLALGDGDNFHLTPAGEQALAQASRETTLTEVFYDTFYQRAASSRAHSRFCTEVYGLDLCQHGMADMQQLDLALERSGVHAGTRLLEFGCGDGRIAEHIVWTRGARVAGVDIAGGAIELARERTRALAGQVQFQRIDIAANPHSLPAGPFDAALAIDSLFFLADQKTAAAQILSRLVPGGRLAVFYIAPQPLTPAETALGRGLAELGRVYETIDLTAANLHHWERKKAVLEELREDFLAEGNAFLYKNRMAECQGWETMQRWLFVVVR
jgi:SAM-dependent methyltransferase